jgi:hypothetical protein
MPSPERGRGWVRPHISIIWFVLKSATNTARRRLPIDNAEKMNSPRRPNLAIRLGQEFGSLGPRSRVDLGGTSGVIAR